MALNKSTLSEQIYDILRDDILHQNRIHCGDKLTLKVLKERFDVSSTPIREALTRLSQDGLVTYYSNIGVTVIQPTKKDLQELYTFIGDLDSLAIRYASQSSQLEALKAELTSLIQIANRHLQAENLKEWESYSDRFHLIFYTYCDNTRLIDSANRIRSQLTIFSTQYEADPLVPASIQAEHEAIYHLFIEDRVTEAMQQMREHLQNSLQFALQYLSS